MWAGTVARAPGWTQRMRVEWLYRLARDPRRVRRQLALPRFVPQVLRGSPDDYGPAAGPGPRGRGRRRTGRTGGAATVRRRRAATTGRRPLRYLISGYYGENNAGDEAILAGIVQEIGVGTRRADFTVLSFDPQDTPAPASGRGSSSPRACATGSLWLAPCVHPICSSAAGAASCTRPTSSSTGARSCFARANFGPCRTSCQWSCWPKLFASRDVVRAGLGTAADLAGPPPGRAGRLGCAAVTWRDPASARLAYEVGVRAPIQSVVPDPAYALAPRGPVRLRELMLARGIRPERRFVAVCPRPWLGRTGYLKRLGAALEKVSEAAGLDVVLVPFQQRKDCRCASRWRAARLAGRARASCPSASPAPLAGVLGGAFAVAMRLHGGILAAAAGTPAVILDYDPKARAFAEQTGQAASP